MRARLLIIPIILACFRMGCATWKSEMTWAYKATGTLGESYRITAQGYCEQKLLTSEVCAKLQTLKNNARAIWIQAGNVLKLAIATEDAIKRQELLTQYNALLAQFNQIFAEFVKLQQKGGTK